MDKPKKIDFLKTAIIVGSLGLCGVNSAIGAGINYVNYHPDNVPNIVTSAGIASEIVFEDDEEITYYTFGFDAAWETAIAKKNILVFKSKDEQPQTNLLVHTSKRDYVFTVTVGNKDWEHHPDKSGAAYSTRIKYYDNKSIPAQQAKEKAKKRAEEAKAAAKKREEESQVLRHRNIHDRTIFIYKDYDYRATKNAAPIIPTRMWDDGELTFMKFPVAQKRGTIYELQANGTTALVNQHTERNGLVVIHGVFNHLIIRLGDEAVETRRNDVGGLRENWAKTTVFNTYRNVSSEAPTSFVKSGKVNMKTGQFEGSTIERVEKTEREQIFQHSTDDSSNNSNTNKPKDL